MNLSRFAKDEKGQAGAVNTQIQLIVSLMVAIIVVYQLFISGVGPTDNENASTYNAEALAAWNNVQLLSWAGIGLMAVVIIILAAAVLMQVIRGGFGGGSTL